MCWKDIRYTYKNENNASNIKIVLKCSFKYKYNKYKYSEIILKVCVQFSVFQNLEDSLLFKKKIRDRDQIRYIYVVQILQYTFFGCAWVHGYKSDHIIT